MSDMFQQEVDDLAADPDVVVCRYRKQRGAEWFRLFKTHLKRSLLSKFRNRGTIYSILLEAPLLALLIGVTLRASPEGSYAFHSGLHLPVYIFLTVTIGMFLGLTNSATEILRDSPVLRRERNCRTVFATICSAALTMKRMDERSQLRVAMASARSFIKPKAP